MCPKNPTREIETPYPIDDSQDPARVQRLCARVKDILTSDERIDYVAEQKRLPVNPIPDTVVLTNRRFIIYRPRLLGRVNFEDYVWRDLSNVHLEVQVIGATITFEATGGKRPTIAHLPKAQARRIYALAQEREETVREEGRLRELEEKRAAAGGVVMHGDEGGTRGSLANGSQDPVERLAQLKRMLDADLISTGEYEAKRAEILAKM